MSASHCTGAAARGRRPWHDWQRFTTHLSWRDAARSSRAVPGALWGDPTDLPTACCAADAQLTRRRGRRRRGEARRAPACWAPWWAVRVQRGGV